LIEDEDKRNQRNKELVQKMRRGESFAAMPPQATWFPPRKIEKKDKKVIAELYCKEGHHFPENSTACTRWGAPKLNAVKGNEG
jgi:hypothetical protein